MFEKLDPKQMSKIKGGMSSYCKTLISIVMNNQLDEGAMEGARYGWNKHCR